MSNVPLHFRRAAAFTLIELLTVIAIIAVLMGLLFPAIGGVREMARKAQAKNDVVGLVNAVKAYYTEYGKYPLPTGSQGEEDYAYSYDGTGSPSNSELIKILIGDQSKTVENPRRIPFIEVPNAKGRDGAQKSGLTNTKEFLDPWGYAYSVVIDSDYDNEVRERGTGKLLNTGVISWSVGKNGTWESEDPSSWK